MNKTRENCDSKSGLFTYNLMSNVFISYIVYTLFLNKSAF